MMSVDDPIHPDQSLRKNVSSKKLINTLSVPMGNKTKNKSSPDIYDELLVRQLSKESATNEPYMQNLKRIREHHQLIMIFIIGGITHSEIK